MHTDKPVILVNIFFHKQKGMDTIKGCWNRWHQFGKVWQVFNRL